MFPLSHKAAGLFAAFLAILAISLHALWPLIAQLKPGEASVLAQACDEGSFHRGSTGDADSAPADGPSLPHCAFCSLAAGDFTALPTPGFDAIPLLIGSKESRPAWREFRLVELSSYSKAKPRAPPALS